MEVDITYPQGEIENHNADGMCAEEYCDKAPTHYFTVKLDEMKLYIQLCEKHWEAFGEMESRITVAPITPL